MCILNICVCYVCSLAKRLKELAFLWISNNTCGQTTYDHVNPMKELPLVRRPLHKAVMGIKKLSGLSAWYILGECG